MESELRERKSYLKEDKQGLDTKEQSFMEFNNSSMPQISYEDDTDFLRNIKLPEFDPTHIDLITFTSRQLQEVAEGAEQLVHKILMSTNKWHGTHFYNLPKYLQDNDFLLHGHRPQLESFIQCFRSIFRIHTETVNIWTHLLGCIAFLVVAAYFISRPSNQVLWREKLIFGSFFFSAILCLGFSFLFHTMSCHSEKMGKLFSRLDYCGITFLIMGSCVPWLYYSFYCQPYIKFGYLTLIILLGIICLVISFWERFGDPDYRWLRAGLFITFGCSGVVPALHYTIANGIYTAMTLGVMGWVGLMGLLYIVGTLMYAFRVPERFFPGKFDLWVNE
ncbi:unnamed protein product [Gordionus sp. m RMFG-2023]